MRLGVYVILAFCIAITVLWVDSRFLPIKHQEIVINFNDLKEIMDSTEKLSTELAVCKERIKELTSLLEKTNAYKIYDCDITAYSLTLDQVGKDPTNTALMEPPRVGGVAVSRDLSWMLGSKIKIDGVGIYRVNDLMAKTLKDGTPITQRVDIYMGKGKGAYDKAIKWGIKSKQVVVITGKD